jgi:hypothetical protein
MPPNPRVGGLDMEIDRPGAPSGDGLRWVKLSFNSTFYTFKGFYAKILKTYQREAISDAIFLKLFITVSVKL